MAHPRRRSRWLQARNAVQRYPILGLALAVAVLGFFLICRSPAAAAVFTGGASHPLLTAAAIALASATLASRGKQRAQARLTHSWLAALPVSHSLLAQSVRAPLTLLAMLIAALAVARTAGLPIAVAVSWLLMLVAGSTVGLSMGWYLPRAQRKATPDSWYAQLRAHRGTQWRASIWPLGSWPVAHSDVWGRPKVTSRQLVVVALAIPMGASAQQALAILMLTLIGLHLQRLALATLPTALQAARWLAPTPLPLLRFTSALLWQSLLRQAVVLVFLVTLLLAAPLLLAVAGHAHPVALAAIWLLVSSLLAVSGCVIAYLASSPDRRTLLSGRTHGR